MTRINGLIAAPFTPFDAKGQLNTKVIPVYADYLKKSGVSGVFVNGTTGEGVSLSLEERMNAALEWTKQQESNFKIIVHVGHNSLKSVQQLAEHAEEIGVDAIGSMSPTFYKPSDINALVDYNIRVAGFSPKTPFYYYHIPSMTGIDCPMIDFLKRVDGEIPNLSGIKFTHENLMDLKLCFEYAERKYTILHGRDEILLSALVLGIRGAVGSTYNYIGPLYTKLIEAFDAGDLELANDLQLKAIDIIQILIKYGGGANAGKSIMLKVGIDLGNSRLPIKSLTRSEIRSLHHELDELQFHDFSLPIKE